MGIISHGSMHGPSLSWRIWRISHENIWAALKDAVGLCWMACLTTLLWHDGRMFDPEWTKELDGRLKWSHRAGALVEEDGFWVKYSPGKLRQNLKIAKLKRKFIFQSSIFLGFHVSFRGCTLPADESVSHLGKTENLGKLKARLGLGLCPFLGINIELMEDIWLKILKIYVKPLENKRNMFNFHIFNWSGISSINLIFLFDFQIWYA